MEALWTGVGGGSGERAAAPVDDFKTRPIESRVDFDRGGLMVSNVRNMLVLGLLDDKSGTVQTFFCEC